MDAAAIVRALTALSPGTSGVRTDVRPGGEPFLWLGPTSVLFGNGEQHRAVGARSHADSRYQGRRSCSRGMPAPSRTGQRG